MKADPRSKRRHAIAALIALAALMASCDNILETIPRKDTGGGTGGGGTLTAVARLAGSSARHALPSLPALAYGALLYHDASSQGDFSSGIVSADGASVAFAFQTPSEQSGLTLEVFAFADGTERADFSREGALLCGKKGDVEIQDDKITAEVALLPNKDASAKGTVSLKVKVPPDCALEIDDTANFAFTADSPDAERTYTVTQKADGITGGAHALTFTVKKGGGVVHVFSEHINVFPGMVTDTWSGLTKGEAREVTQAMLSTTVYVRGAGGWYDGSADFKDTAAASDDNPGSLMRPFATIQKAVDTIIARNDRSSAYTILVDGTLTYDGSNTNGMADISPTKALNLKIQSMSAVTNAMLDAQNNGRALYIGANAAVTLKNVNITNGNAADYGGGIYNQGTITIEGGTISDCTAGINGGGICNSDSSVSAEITDCKIIGCKANGTSVGNGGGGIYNYLGGLTLTDVTITGGGDSANPEARTGGGIYNNNGTLTVIGGTITNCTAISAGAIYNAGALTVESGTTISGCTANLGGGIFSNVTDTSVTSTITDCTITGCKATGSGSGGGIYNSNGTLTLSGVTITGENNTASPDATEGGGIYNSAGGALTIKDSTTISACVVRYSGGGIYNAGTLTVSGGSIENCTAGTSGGGIYNNVTDASITCTLTDCTISGCEALGTASGQGGGGICNNAGTLELTDVNITGSGDETAQDARSGGGIYNKGTLTVTGGAIKNCTSLYAGGGVYNSTGTLKITDGTISACKTKEGRGGGICSSGTGASAEIKDCIIQSCEATTSSGGGISNETGTLTITGGKITDCTATQNGGGIYNNVSDTSVAVKIENCEISGCKALGTKSNNGGYGGGIYNAAGTLELTSVNITGSGDETAQDACYGGGIYNKGTLTVTGGEITACVASSAGGGTYNSAGTFKISGGTISTNTAKVGGGGVYIYSGTFTMSDGTISGNSSKNAGGGGVYIMGGTFIMGGGTISGNTASNNGGGVCKGRGGTFNANGGTVSGNSPDDVYNVP